MERWLLETPKEEPFHGLSGSSIVEFAYPSFNLEEALGYSLHYVEVDDIILDLSVASMECQESRTA